MLPTNKFLIFIVVGLGVILLMGFGALIMGLVMKAKSSTADANIPSIRETVTKDSQSVKIKIPKGFRIKNITSNSTQIVFHIVNEQGEEELFIFDQQIGKMSGHYKIEVKR